MITVKANVLLCQNDDYKFWGLDFAKKHGFSKESVEVDYKKVYEESFRFYTNPTKDQKLEILEQIFEKLNVHHPQGYNNRSLSVSDIVCFEQDGDKEYWYCDRFGWSEVEGPIDPQFLNV